MKFIVAQHGRRRGYVIPTLLARAGMLERFYTDLCADVGLGRWLNACRHFPPLRARMSRLANRRLTPEIARLTSSFGLAAVRQDFGALLRRSDPVSQFRASMLESMRTGRAMVARGFGEATHLYMMLDEFPPLMRAARERGLKVVSDVYILLSTERILAEERRRFPGWEPDVPDYDPVRRELGVADVLLTQVDHYLCPSEAVRDDLVAHWGVARERTSLLPYAVTFDWSEPAPEPVPGRVLFVGIADLRKGIHYFALAAEKLRASGRSYEFRVAGNVTPAVTGQAVCRHLNFLGRVPLSVIRSEYERADLLVLPTLAEGAAGVTFEALSAKVPQVVTPAAGSVARDGIEGLIVPERDPDALADAIERIVEDRALRDRLAQASLARAREFAWDKFGDRLMAALREMDA